MKQDRRGSWYLLTGALIGIIMGLFYSWVISPVEYVDAPPYALRADFKDEYRALVAAAYVYSSDLLRAENRLGQLKDDDIAQSLALQAQNALQQGRPEAEVRALGILTKALNEGLTPRPSNNQPATSSSTALQPDTSQPGYVNPPTSDTAVPIPLQTTSTPVPNTPVDVPMQP